MKCQISVPILKRLPRSNTDRITILEKRIKQVEGGGGKGRYHNDSNSSSSNNTNEYKQLKEELAYLLKQEAKNDILKSICTVQRVMAIDYFVPNSMMRLIYKQLRRKDESLLFWLC